MFITRKELFDILRSTGSSRMEEQFNFLTEEIKKRTKCDKEYFKDLKRKLSHFRLEYKSRWMKTCRKDEKIQKSNERVAGYLNFLLLIYRVETGSHLN